MPTYPVTTPDGRVIPVTGDSPPTEQELEEIYAALPAPQISLASPEIAIGDPLQQAVSSSVVPRGGVPGVNYSPEVARFIAGQRVLARELESRGSAPGLTLGPGGELLETTTPMASPRAFLEGAARGPSFGLSDAVSKLVLNPDFRGEEQPRVQSPQAFALGEALGNFIPTTAIGSAIVKPGARLAEKVVGGLKVGAPAGAILGASEVLTEEGREASLTDIITNSIGFGTVGAGIGMAIPGTVNAIPWAARGIGKAVKGALDPVESLQKMGVLKSPEALAIKVLDPKGNDVREVAQAVASGRILNPFQDIKSEGAFNDAGSLISQAKKALATKSKAINDLIEKNPSIKINGTEAADAMVAEVSTDPLLLQRNPEVIDLVQSNAQALRRDIPLKESFDLLNSINKRHENYFTASVKGQNTKELDAEFATDEIMRKFLSRKINDVSEGLSGTAANPFREYGSINDVVQKVTKEFHDATVNRLRQVGGGVAEDYITKLDISKPGTWIAPSKFLRGGELGDLNRNINSLNNTLPAKKAAKVLTTQERLSKLKGAVATPPLLPETQAAMDAAALATQEQAALNDILAAEIAQARAAQSIQGQTGVGSFAPSAMQINQTQALEAQRALEDSILRSANPNYLPGRAGQF